MAGSFKTDILPLFRPQDITCMTRRGIRLGDYEWMSNPKNAAQVYNHLTGKETPRMPPDGKFWDAAMLKKFNDWMKVDPKFQP